MGPEATGEDLAVVGEDLVGHAVGEHRLLEDLTHRSRCRPRDEARSDAEAAVVVDTGHDLEIGAVVEHDAAHDVHLPQLHGPIAFPATELVASFLPPPEFDEVVPLEAAIDARATRQRVDTLFAELVQDPQRSPAGVLAADLADHRLELGRDLVRTALRFVGAIGESRQASGLVASDPVVDTLARDAKVRGDLGDLPAVLDHGHDCLITLLHDAQLHQHLAPPYPTTVGIRK